MRETTREIAVSRIPKEKNQAFKEDEKFIEFITNELTREISERLIKAIEANDEIVIKKPVLKVSDFDGRYPPTYYVEYRKTVDWEPLVRCKDCKHCKHSFGYTTEYGLYFCLTCVALDRDVDDEFFCSYGERRDDEDRRSC